MKNNAVGQKKLNGSKVFISTGYARGNSNQAVTCDLCGKTDAGKVHFCYNYVYLCSDCLKYLNTLPIYNQKCIERFMIGNVF
ncbi:MAG: hypothetical protein GY749_42965 [Desulfobacteraceae bacterium]|nr:hypothetical protein [Desulfobacteraceae bacterium]